MNQIFSMREKLYNEDVCLLVNEPENKAINDCVCVLSILYMYTVLSFSLQD